MVKVQPRHLRRLDFKYPPTSVGGITLSRRFGVGWTLSIHRLPSVGFAPKLLPLRITRAAARGADPFLSPAAPGDSRRAVSLPRAITGSARRSTRQSR